MANIIQGGKPHVVLIASPGRIHTDLAARFTYSEKSLDELVVEGYNAKLVNNILSRGHLASTEFDYFVFGVEGVSRVTETQLVRKRIASYLIKSGRVEKGGKRSFDVIQPPSIYKDFMIKVNMDGHTMYARYADIMNMLEQWYDGAVMAGIPEEDARYMKPQGTETKIIIGMNARSLLDFWGFRCCFKAAWEIRAMAYEMLRLVKEATQETPEIFAKAGARCQQLGYCPENEGQCREMRLKEITLDELMAMKDLTTPY